MNYTTCALPKPGGSTQPKRSRQRKRKWRNFQEWAHENLPAECEKCGETIPNGVQPSNLSHIEHRKMGGTWRKWINELANIRVLCEGCHDKYPGWNGIKATIERRPDTLTEEG